MDNPAFFMWKVIDGQLLRCITASLSVSILPLVLGLEYVGQVWQTLENRFNSVTRSHVRDLKRRLYNLKKTGTMETYLNQIKAYAQQLGFVGHNVDDDDLVFYTLKGLPSEFRQLKTAVRTKGDARFNERVTLLNAEDSEITHGLDTEVSGVGSVLVATQKPQDLDLSQLTHRMSSPHLSSPSPPTQMPTQTFSTPMFPGVQFQSSAGYQSYSSIFSVWTERLQWWRF